MVTNGALLRISKSLKESHEASRAQRSRRAQKAAQRLRQRWDIFPNYHKYIYNYPMFSPMKMMKTLPFWGKTQPFSDKPTDLPS